jgi:hypothetical protein
MAKLVADDEIYDYMQITTDEDPAGNLLLIRNSIEDLLEEKTSKKFGLGASYTDESYDGSGTKILYLLRPIQTLTAIKFRYGVDALTDYDIDVATACVFTVGKRRIAIKTYTGMDIVVFPRGYDNILVTYTSAAYQPDIAKQAVREAVASIYRRIGSEDARSEQIGSFHHVLIRSLEELPSWKSAIESLHLPAIG